MKMFKKLMAVVLTGVMAVSMLTGCAVNDKFVESAAKDAMKELSDATFTVSSNKDDKTATTNARKKMTEWAKKEDNKKVAPTQDIVDELLNDDESDSRYYILIDYSTSKSTVKGSIDGDVRTLLKSIPSTYKVKYRVSESFSAAKKDGSSTKKDYALIVLCSAELKNNSAE